jgi:alkanesulfonate monooxygenase SsuD/methylene tetrahydromethanopterin reductase-like flavin-dependent oxidoreductase (luciferase family)
MRIGVTVPNVHETLAERTTIEAVGRMADELGFDSIWCNDHLAIPSAGGDSAAGAGLRRGPTVSSGGRASTSR